MIRFLRRLKVRVFGTDDTLVECPKCEYLDRKTGVKAASREFIFITGEIGRRDYCRNCGSELVEKYQENDEPA